MAINSKQTEPATFYEEGEPLIQPRHTFGRLRDEHGDPVRLPGTAVCTFFADATEALAKEAGASPDVRWRTMAGHERYAYTIGDSALLTLPVGAPAAVLQLEGLIELGVRRVVVVGAAGAIQPDIHIGDTAIATSAIREEGTSYHYAPAGVEATADAGIARDLAEACANEGLAPRLGEHWTTDAPYRELRERIARYRERGVLSVDMEVSALYVVAALRGVPCAAVLAISDELHRSDWEEGFSRGEYRGALAAAGRAGLRLALKG